MIHRIANITTAGAAANSYYATAGRLSHLLFGMSVAPDAGSFVTVTLNSPYHEPKVLVNRISQLLLSDISDIENGASAVLQTLLNSVGATDYIGWFFAIDLGHLDLQATNSKLEILVETDQAVTQGTLAMVDVRPTAHDFIHKYSNSSLLVNGAPDTDRVYVTYITGSLVPFTDANLNDLSVEVHSDYGDRFCTIQDMVGFTAVFGEIESQAPQRVFVAFMDNEDTVGNVDWQLSGTDADADIAIIARSKILDPIRVAKSLGGSIARTQNKLAGKSPDVQTAHVLAGVAPSPVEMDAAKKSIDAHATKLITKRGTA